MKNLIKLVLLLGVIVYLVFAFTRFNKPNEKDTCQAVNIVITDSAQASFIDADEVDRLLKDSRLYPLGRTMVDINGKAIQQFLLKNPLIADAVCFKAPGGEVNISIKQRLPVVRIMADNGEDYFIDNKGSVMPRVKYAADVVIATGHISHDYARRHLFRLGRHIQNDPFWNDQTEQIHVAPCGRPDPQPGKTHRLTEKAGKPKGFLRKSNEHRWVEQICTNQCGVQQPNSMYKKITLRIWQQTKTSL